MRGIPGWVYVLIGAAMALFAKFVENKTDRNLNLFFWIGIVFIVIGVGKYIFKAVFRKKAKKPKKEKKLTKTTYQTHQETPPSQTQHHIHKAQQPQHPTIISCRACGARHYDYANYCMKCGAKIKK